MIPKVAPSQDILDIVHPTSGVDGIFVFQVLAFSAVGAGLIAFCVCLYLRRRRMLTRSKARTMPPQQEATLALDKVEMDLDGLSPNDLMLRTSNIVKTYLLARYDDPLSFESLEEFLGRDEDSLRLPDRERCAVVTFLTRCEAVKFGKFPDAKAQCRPLLASARKIVTADAVPDRAREESALAHA